MEAIRGWSGRGWGNRSDVHGRISARCCSDLVSVLNHLILGKPMIGASKGRRGAGLTGTGNKWLLKG
eukprot:748378-Hanusia_phi.AAC.3